MCQTAITTARSRALSRGSLFSVLVVALLFSFVYRAAAAPPPDATLTNQQWFESLEQPGERHLLCCSIADCHFATVQVTGAGYEVAIENFWIVVPSDRILQHVSNPTGRAVVCYRHIFDLDNNQTEIIRIFCFVRPTES